MTVRPYLPGYGKLSVFHSAGVRTGIYVGACFSLIFVAWVMVANRMPLLERFASERNAAAAGAISLVALIPVLRFFGMPGRLWLSGTIAWGILSVSYRLLGVWLPGLEQRYGAFQVFMVGAVVYTIIATICWIASVMRRMRSARVPAGAVHHAPASPPNHRMT